MEKLDATVQDARALLKTAGKYSGPNVDNGIDAELVALLSGAIERAVAADTTQRNAIRDVDRYTEAQDKAMDKALLYFRKLQSSAKARFGVKDGAAMREFRVGSKPSKTVKGMANDLAYMRKMASKYAGELNKFGFKAPDLSALDQASTDLVQVDSSQELAKKAQKNATEARNKAVADLVRAMQTVRNTAKSVFAGRKDILTEFESIKRAKAVRKDKTANKPAAGAGAASSSVGAGA